MTSVNGLQIDKPVSVVDAGHPRYGVAGTLVMIYPGDEIPYEVHFKGRTPCWFRTGQIVPADAVEGA